MARGVRTLLALAALPRAATLQAEPLQAEPLQAEVQPEAQQLPDFSAPARARSAMMPELEHGSNHRVGSVPNATLSDCLLCVTHPADSPKLWVQESSDGVGTRVHNMLIAMAVAAKNGMNIAGFVSIPFECPIRIYHGMPYNVDPKLVYDYFFGLNSTDLFVNMRQPHVAKYSSMAELEKYTTDLIPIGKPDPLAPGSQSFIEHADILMQFGSLRTTKSQIQQYITKDFISNLRAMGSRVTSHPTFFAKDGRPTVAVHVRRGDVKRLSANNHRWSPDSWYLDKINKIRHILPDADVHVFTNVDENTDKRDLYLWNSSNMTVHTDEDKQLAAHATMDAWAHFAQADIVVLSRSSYSHVPAMLNTNCVIYQEYWNAPLEEWIWAEDSEEGSKNLFDMGAFNTCIRRIARPSWGILGATR